VFRQLGLYPAYALANGRLDILANNEHRVHKLIVACSMSIYGGEGNIDVTSME
jgi:hypothetical protein